MPRERISTRSNIPISTSNPRLNKKSVTVNSNPEVKIKQSSKTRSKNSGSVADGVGSRRHLSVVDSNATYIVKSEGNNLSVDKNEVFHTEPSIGSTTMPRERISTRSNIPVSSSNPKVKSKKSETENANPEVRIKGSSKTRSRNSQSVADGVGVRRHLSVVDSNATYAVKSSESNLSLDKNEVFHKEPSNKCKVDDQPCSIDNVVAKASNAGERNKFQDQKVSDTIPLIAAAAASLPDIASSSDPKYHRPQILLQFDDHPYHDVVPDGVVNIEVEDGLYEYSREVVVYLMELETVNPIPVDFLEEGSISVIMRSILVDWLIQVQHHLKLCQETLYLAVGILDMVLHRRDVDTDKLQLVGITALLVASKLEEYYPADMKKLLHLTENSYSRLQITHMERTILGVLEFQVYLPSPQVFLLRFTRAALRGGDSEFLKTCQYFFDSHLPHPCHPSNSPSCLAAAAVACATLVYHQSANPEATSVSVSPNTIWTPTLRHYSTYNLSSILSTCKEMMNQVLAAASDNTKLIGSITKYKSYSQHQRVALAKHLALRVLQRSSLVLDEWLQ